VATNSSYAIVVHLVKHIVNAGKMIIYVVKHITFVLLLP
jgi:hypothetical protein